MTDNNSTLFNRLRALQASCSETNKHDQVTVLIIACLMEGVDTRDDIIRQLTGLGYDPRHVAILLKEGTGTSSERHLWRRDGEGRYNLLEGAMAEL